MLERIVEFHPAFDRRDPRPEKNYGVGAVTLRMSLKGEVGVVQFVVFTGWYLPHVAAEMRAAGQEAYIAAGDLGYHSPYPQYGGQKVTEESCGYLDGRPCYYDGSGLNAQPVFDRLLREGHEAVWEELERYYESLFGEGENDD